QGHRDPAAARPAPPGPTGMSAGRGEVSTMVVGAGPAGSMLAILLSRQGRRVVVYESRPDLREVEIGAGRSINLALANRGIVALEAVGVYDRVEPIVIPMRGRMIHGPDGSTELQPYGNRPDEVIHSVSRSALNAILLDAAESLGVRIHFGHRCRSVDLDAGEARFEVAGAGGGSHELTVGFHAVFGADGANSVVRDATLAANGGRVHIEPLDHGYKELTLSAGPGGRSRLDPNALHIWPREEFMSIALANPAGDFTVTLFLAERGTDPSFATLTGPAEVESFFGREFPDLAALVPDVARQFQANPTGSLATVRCRGWSHEARSVILGDAAHAVVPFHGQGMNAAFESCLVLDRHLGNHTDDPAAALTAFEHERRPDTDAIADMALENYVEMRSGVIDPAHRLRRELALELERRWPDVFVPRYAMVMFHTMPYSAARARAGRQAAVLEELTDGVASVDEVDFERAGVLVERLKEMM
ncbi:MAG: FAD-dependent oxidoreductase, partial [Acidimicrobiales bacterium]